MSGFTKEIIAKTFTELLDEKPMSKITVKDIVERCGVNRNTFYYHFKDIPDVVEFILKKKWDEILELDADEIINMKMSQNEAKYPVDKAKGSAAKYDQL